MTIFLNGNAHQFEDNCTLLNVLEHTQYAQKKGVAVGVNNEVVQKEKWSNTTLTNNDKVIVISATKGG